MSEKLAVGTRIELIRMPDDPDPIQPGATGTVTGGGVGQVWVKWDNGRSLCLLHDVDEWRVIQPEEEEE